MTAWRIQRHLQKRLVMAHQGKVPLRAALLVVFDAHVGVIAEAVGGDVTPYARDQIADHRIIDAHYRTAVKRQIVQKVDKRLLQVFEVALVGVHMVSFNIGHYRHHRLQMQERGVALVRFRNQVTTAAEPRMRARRLYQAAVDEGRIQTALCIDARHHRRGGGFAVRAGDSDAVTKTH